ncbi:similar to An01g04770 [Aspergillus luchuensis]|uniref:Similar to An01g04770 n=1 Tax=Aspergillus kawachii TaxID=1069201 RepID=A0A146F7Q2_ASPKA|nr:similar to An01g04770 [Aspergillus luchuensis]
MGNVGQPGRVLQHPSRHFFVARQFDSRQPTDPNFESHNSKLDCRSVSCQAALDGGPGRGIS